MLLVPICRDMQLWCDKPLISSLRNCMPTETCFDDVGRICACVTWTQMYVTLQTKMFSIQKQSLFFFLISLFVSFFRYSFQYRRNSIRPSTQFIHICRRSAVETIICLGPCIFTLRIVRFVDVGIIYPILGKVLFQISFTNYENILAHNTALVTSGNSGLPRLNSSRTSSDTPLPSQSPIWVNPMGPIPLSFGKKCHNVTTLSDTVIWSWISLAQWMPRTELRLYLIALWVIC